MATVTLTPKDPAKGEPIEITSDKVNTDGTLNSDEQTTITAEAKKKNSEFNLSDYDAVIEGKKQALDTANASAAKPAEEKKSSGGSWGAYMGADLRSVLQHMGLKPFLRGTYTNGNVGVELELGFNVGLEGDNNSGFSGGEVGINATYKGPFGVYGIGGVRGGLINGDADCFLSQEQIDEIVDSGGTVPDDLRTGTCGYYAGGAAFDRQGEYLGVHAGLGKKFTLPGSILGKKLVLDTRATVGSSLGSVTGHNEGDDDISVGGNFDWNVGVAIGLDGSSKKVDHDKDGIEDALDRCDFTPDNEKKQIDKKGDYKGCSPADKAELRDRAIITEKDPATGISTHTVKTSDIPENVGDGDDPKVREADITAKPGDTIIVDGPDGKGWPKGTKVKFNDDDPITETNEEAGVSLNPGEPVKITVPEGVTGENTIEIQNEKGETVVRIKLTVEEPEVKPEPIEDAKIDRVVVSSKDPNPEVRVTMTSPVAGKLEAEFRKKGDANAKPIPADVEPQEIKEEQVGQPVELKVTAKEKLAPGEYDLIINVLDAEGKVVATGKAETETGDPLKAVNKDELTAAVKMSSASDDVKTADLIEVNSEEKVDFRFEMSKPTAKVTMRILSLDQYGEVSGEVGRDDTIGTIKGRKIDGKYIVERKGIDLPELDGGDEGTQYRIVLEIEDTDGMKFTPEINILVLPGKPTSMTTDKKEVTRTGGPVKFTFNRAAAGKKGTITYQVVDANGVAKGLLRTVPIEVTNDNSFTFTIGVTKIGGQFGQKPAAGRWVKYTVKLDGVDQEFGGSLNVVPDVGGTKTPITPKKKKKRVGRD